MILKNINNLLQKSFPGIWDEFDFFLVGGSARSLYFWQLNIPIKDYDIIIHTKEKLNIISHIRNYNTLNINNFGGIKVKFHDTEELFDFWTQDINYYLENVSFSGNYIAINIKNNDCYINRNFYNKRLTIKNNNPNAFIHPLEERYYENKNKLIEVERKIINLDIDNNIYEYLNIKIIE